MDMITLSKSEFDGQPWVNPDRTAASDEEIPSGPVSCYCRGFFLGQESWAFVRSEVGSSASSCGGAGRGARGLGRGRSGLWRGVGEGVVVVVRRLGEGWVDGSVGQRGSELTYRLRGNDAYIKIGMVPVSWLSAGAVEARELTRWLFAVVWFWVGTSGAQTAFQAALQ
jgi:hypothetical protein